MPTNDRWLSYAPGLAIDPAELDIRFVRASGPGGQKVNKVSTAVVLRFDLAGSAQVPEPVRQRAARLAGRRLSAAGVIVIEADRHRTQAANRRDAIDRLLQLLAAAAPAQRPRRPTRAGKAAIERRLAGKGHRGGLKRSRRPPAIDD